MSVAMAALLDRSGPLPHHAVAATLSGMTGMSNAHASFRVAEER
jgi:hypothetical protein